MTKEWNPLFEPSFDEISLFHGRVKNPKRRAAEQVGMVKCKIKLFMREDETLAGKSKKDESRDPEFYEVGPEDLSIHEAMDLGRPYRMYNINETYEEATVEVRVYCLRAFQVTPGGFERSEDGEKFWLHYLTCNLGKNSDESNVVKALNPNFFHVFVFKNCSIPGPSQLIIQLRDAKLSMMGKVDNSRLIGETTIDLEDRWFCDKWRNTKYKPREIRDLVNDDQTEPGFLPGVSQGKLSLFVDVLDQTKADENEAEDIQVLGKTLPMELRIIIWNTQDTAPKDSYTSDVYVACELLGIGTPKLTDVHSGVKIKAFGMFNWRLKWRCKFPDMNNEFLLRVALWDDNLLTAHQSIGEGVLPLKRLFKECFDRNQGKTSPDDMEHVFLYDPDDPDKNYMVDQDNIKYPCTWFSLLHPNVGFNPAKDSQGRLQITVQVMPRAKARASPAGAQRRGPAKMPEPGRPPQPANPILQGEQCKAYIAYTISEFFKSCRTPCICLVCCLLIAVILAAMVGVRQGLGV